MSEHCYQSISHSYLAISSAQFWAYCCCGLTQLSILGWLVYKKATRGAIIIQIGYLVAWVIKSISLAPSYTPELVAQPVSDSVSTKVTLQLSLTFCSLIQIDYINCSGEEEELKLRYWTSSWLYYLSELLFKTN